MDGDLRLMNEEMKNEEMENYINGWMREISRGIFIILGNWYFIDLIFNYVMWFGIVWLRIWLCFICLLFDGGDFYCWVKVMERKGICDKDKEFLCVFVEELVLWRVWMWVWDFLGFCCMISFVNLSGCDCSVLSFCDLIDYDYLEVWFFVFIVKFVWGNKFGMSGKFVLRSDYLFCDLVL